MSGWLATWGGVFVDGASYWRLLILKKHTFLLSLFHVGRVGVSSIVASSLAQKYRFNFTLNDFWFFFAEPSWRENIVLKV